MKQEAFNAPNSNARSIPDLIEDGVSRLSVWVLLALPFVMTIEVIMRYLVKMPHDWANELFFVMTMYLTFLMAGIAFRRRRHIVLDVISSRMKGSWRLSSEIINDIALITGIGAFTVFLFFYLLWLYAQGAKTETSMGTPDWVIALPFFIGMATMVFFAIEHLILLLRGWTRKSFKPDSMEEP